MAYVSKAPKLPLVGSLDGMRAISFLLVFMVHVIGPQAASFVGSVDVFFVVSGFLISTLILQEYRATDRIAFRKFYTRRALRLLPPLYPALIFTGVMAYFVKGGEYFGQALKEIASAFFYVYHVVFASAQVGGTEAATSNENVNFLTHLWTLSVEEHFYLFIPIVLFFAIKKNFVRAFAVLATLFVILAFVARMNNDVGPLLFWLYRPDSLLIGVLAAIVNAEMPTELSAKQERLLGIVGTVAAFVGGATLLASTSIMNKLGVAITFTKIEGWDVSNVVGEDRFGLTWTQFGFTAVAISVAIVTVVLVRLPNWWAQRPLSIRPLQYVGRRSYTLYIWHIPILILVAQAIDEENPWFGGAVPPGIFVLAGLGLLIGVAVASYRYIEVPALRLKMRRYVADPDAVDLTKSGERSS